MKVIVKIKRWLRGDAKEDFSTLHDGDTHRQCCLGFACRQAGIPIDAIRGLNMPDDMAPEYRALVPQFVRGDNPSRLAKLAARINDDADIEDKERMSQLRKLFRKHGHQIVFVK